MHTTLQSFLKLPHTHTDTRSQTQLRSHAHQWNSPNSPSKFFSSLWKFFNFFSSKFSCYEKFKIFMNFLEGNFSSNFLIAFENFHLDEFKFFRNYHLISQFFNFFLHLHVIFSNFSLFLMLFYTALPRICRWHHFSLRVKSPFLRHNSLFVALRHRFSREKLSDW